MRRMTRKTTYMKGDFMMKIFTHKSHTAVELFKNKVFIKNNEKIQMFNRHVKFANWRFIIHPNRRWTYFRWFFRVPFFYFEKDNCSIKIGTPNSYMWFIKKYI